MEGSLRKGNLETNFRNVGFMITMEGELAGGTRLNLRCPMGNNVDGPQVGRLRTRSLEIHCSTPIMYWRNRNVGIYIGMKNLESSAAQAGNCETNMMNLHELRPPSWIFLVLHHGFSFMFLFSDSGVLEVIGWKGA